MATLKFEANLTSKNSGGSDEETNTKKLCFGDKFFFAYEFFYC